MNILYEKLFGRMNGVEYPEKLSVLPDFSGGISLNDNGEIIGKIKSDEFHSEILTGDNEVIANVIDGPLGGSDIHFVDGETFFGISNIDGIESWVNPFDGSMYNLSEGVDGSWTFSEAFSDMNLDVTDNMMGGVDIATNFLGTEGSLTSIDHLDRLYDVLNGIDIIGSATESVERIGVMDHLLNILDGSDLIDGL